MGLHFVIISIPLSQPGLPNPAIQAEEHASCSEQVKLCSPPSAETVAPEPSKRPAQAYFECDTFPPQVHLQSLARAMHFQLPHPFL